MDNNTFGIPIHEQIERLAYQIYLEHGFHPGNALEDWLAAEKELRNIGNRAHEDPHTSVQQSAQRPLELVGSHDDI
jgi:DUF2934 family protein